MQSERRYVMKSSTGDENSACLEVEGGEGDEEHKEAWEETVGDVITIETLKVESDGEVSVVVGALKETTNFRTHVLQHVLKQRSSL